MIRIRIRIIIMIMSHPRTACQSSYHLLHATRVIRMYRLMMDRLAQLGYTSASLGYRVYPEGDISSQVSEQERNTWIIASAPSAIAECHFAQFLLQAFIIK